MEVGRKEDYPRILCEDMFRFHSPSSETRSAALGYSLISKLNWIEKLIEQALWLPPRGTEPFDSIAAL
jgi:hypothetical protein